MLIAQISDLHFLPKGALAYGEVAVADHLERAIAELNAADPPVDAVLITGDLTSDGDATVFADLVETLSALDAPYYPIPGNHDPREVMRSAFAELGCLPAEGRLCFAIDDFPVRLIGLDSLIEGSPAGDLGAEQTIWLDRRLAEAPERPTMVALHHPPFRTGIGHMDWSMLRDADALAEVLRRHPQVERVVCGHVHRSVQQRFAGTIGQIAPGVAHQVELVLGPERRGWICEPPGYLLHYWSPEAGLVTHLCFIGAYGPRGPFNAPHRPAAPHSSE